MRLTIPAHRSSAERFAARPQTAAIKGGFERSLVTYAAYDRVK
jgi:hypothetical protein